MKFITEYRDPEAIKKLACKIAKVAADLPPRNTTNSIAATFMEVCGTHTMAIARFGIKGLLPSNIRLLSGPGCPVCVTPNEYIDHAIALSMVENVIITTFGDMIRVPGSESSLEVEKSAGHDIRIVYSPLDALDIARQNPGKEIVFLSVGFETTIPTIASTLIMAKKDGIRNFSVLTANKVVPPALEALLDGKLSLDGFILPGHVSTIIGGSAYSDIVVRHSIPCSIAGFEPTDILESILDLVEQNVTKTPRLSIKYSRVVNMEGNPRAKKAMGDVFEPTDSTWRGIGVIPKSGLKLNEGFRYFDAAARFKVSLCKLTEEKGCLCGAILQGLKEPPDCPLFGSRCTPETPVGACMVSSEGTCAAWHRYSDNRIKPYEKRK